MDLFEQLERPVLFTSDVTRELGCSDETARNRFAELVEREELTRIDLGGRQAAWLREDYREASAVARQLRKHLDLSTLKTDFLDSFAEQPYKLLPKDEDEYYLVVPRFVPFTLGHIRDVDGRWVTFVVNKYVSWIDDIPEPLQDELGFDQRYEQAIVEDSILKLANPDERDRAWKDLGGEDGQLLDEPIDEDKIKIEPGKDFEVIANLIENGNLPFAANPLNDEELRDEPNSIELRPYQQRAWETFQNTGQIGVYWPPGLGKTFIGLYAGDRIPGKKLVVVPGRTLESQWEARIEEHCRNPDEWEVRTYWYLIEGENIQEYQGESSPRLTIFDESHFLPATSFSTLSTIDTDFRIGCSATPYREDERTDYIFALTGVPVGIEWEELLQYGNLDFPEVNLYLYGSEEEKRADLRHLISTSQEKTLIFCDGIADGEDLAEEFAVPFVNGQTPPGDRLAIFEDNPVVIASKVADEGLSLDHLDRVIEFDFHGKSRRQELQRAGRVMHSDGVGRHIVQMTEEEYHKYSDRLLSLKEKGMDILRERRSL